MPNVRKTPEALKALISSKAIALMEKYQVLSKRELHSRHDVYLHAYHATVEIEANCALTIARTLLVPAVMRYAKELSETIAGVKAAGGGKLPETAKLLGQVSGGCDLLLRRAAELENAVEGKSADKMLEGMVQLRAVADAMEGVVPHDKWPLPSYTDMMFVL